MKPRAAAVAAAAVLGIGCTQQTNTLSNRTLSRSGRSAFVCLDRPQEQLNPPPKDASEYRPGLPTTRCSRVQSTALNDYGTLDAPLPHLFALVTQTVTGEVAVVDMTTPTSTTNPIIDEDPGTPGANFLPIGAQPTDIVATPGGTATFVGVAEVGHAGIFALPSTQIRPSEARPAPTLSSWPACSLPSAPGDMLLVADPPGPSGSGSPSERPSCDDAYGAHAEAVPADLDLSKEGQGRQKLVVELPEAGGFVVIDAQRLLTAKPGSFGPCPVERWVPLKGGSPQVEPPSTPPHGPECVDPALPPQSAVPIGAPHPSGLAFADKRLFLGDLDQPVVHVVDMPTPCEPVEVEPLFPTSIADPSRVVTTSRVAVSEAATPEFRRYLYALDTEEGSVMAFDVSDGAKQRTPLSRPHPEWNPFEPPDRIRFSAPVRDIAVVHRDVPATVASTGVAPEGIRCNPDPSLTPCDAQHASCDLPTAYRTSIPNYDSGAGPLKLRGTFAFMVLTNGQVAVGDIDDLDASCRGPFSYSPLFGCPPVGFTPTNRATDKLFTSGEVSCNVFIPNTPRGSTYVLSSDKVGRHEPGIQTYPILFDSGGTALPLSDGRPIMRATLPPASTPQSSAVVPFITVGTDRLAITQTRETSGGINATGLVEDSANEPKHTLIMNLEDPHVHVYDQTWSVIYEGALPGFGSAVGRLDLSGAEGQLDSIEGTFCDRGVQSEASVRAQFDEAFFQDALKRTAMGLSLVERVAQARSAAQARVKATADVVQIASALPAESDTETWSKSRLTYAQCQQKFGDADAPSPAREIPILEAYSDHLVLEKPADADDIATCFNALIKFNIRARSQWIVIGSGSGFLHHVIADPTSGACRNSCDPRLVRSNGRALHAPAGVTAVQDGELYAFQNPMFRFAITGATPQRDTFFRFATQGSFQLLAASLASSPDVTELQPQFIRYVPATGELAITDGSLEGLILLSASSVGVSRRFY